MVIFPQGTRRRHKILDFKRGAFKLAQEANVPIVPVTIELPEKLYAVGCHVSYSTQEFKGFLSVIAFRTV